MLVLQDGPLRSRILGISPSRTATVCFALPLKEFLEQVTAGLTCCGTAALAHGKAGVLCR